LTKIETVADGARRDPQLEQKFASQEGRACPACLPWLKTKEKKVTALRSLSAQSTMEQARAGPIPYLRIFPIRAQLGIELENSSEST